MCGAPRAKALSARRVSTPGGGYRTARNRQPPHADLLSPARRAWPHMRSSSAPISGVEYGLVRAADLPETLKTHHATPEMRRVRLNLADRLVVIPVDLVAGLLPLAIAMAVACLLGGWLLRQPQRVRFLPASCYSACYPGCPHATSVQRGVLLGFRWRCPLPCCLPAWRRPGMVASHGQGADAIADLAGGYRVRGVELHRLHDLHLVDRRGRETLPGCTDHGRDVRGWPGADAGRGRNQALGRRAMF